LNHVDVPPTVHTRLLVVVFQAEPDVPLQVSVRTGVEATAPSREKSLDVDAEPVQMAPLVVVVAPQ